MYERMLTKNELPTMSEMGSFCKENAQSFQDINEWLINHFGLETKIVFPYGNNYGWGVAHKKKNRLIANVFPENGSFSVMFRLTKSQLQQSREHVSEYARNLIDHYYPCSDGGWIQYRVSDPCQNDDLKLLLTLKFS